MKAVAAALDAAKCDQLTTALRPFAKWVRSAAQSPPVIFQRLITHVCCCCLLTGGTQLMPHVLAVLLAQVLSLALIQACKEGHRGATVSLLQAGAAAAGESVASIKEHYDFDTDEEELPLHAACTAGAADCVIALLDAGADPLSGDSHDRDALLHRILRSDSVACLAVLRDRGLLAQFFPAGDMTPAAIGAARAGALKCLAELVRLGVDVPSAASDRTGETPLMAACKSGRESATAWLCERGAPVDAMGKIWSGSPERDETTALLEAIRAGSLECVRILVRHGADPNLQGPQSSNTPLSKALAAQHLSDATTLGIAHLLLDHGACAALPPPWSGRTSCRPLPTKPPVASAAGHSRNSASFARLLARLAAADAPPEDVWQALQEAVRCGNDVAVQVLFAHLGGGGDHAAAVSAMHGLLRLLLDEFCEGRNLMAIADELLDRGADPRAKDADGGIAPLTPEGAQQVTRD